MPEPGWVRDPSGRYHQRYFDGVRWTEHVADEYGRRGLDPIESIPRPADPGGRRAETGGTPVWSVRAALGLAGSVLALVAIVALPWYENLRIAQAGSPAAGGAGLLEASYFESGWIVTIIAVVVAAAAAFSSASSMWPASVPVGLCALWAAVSTVVLKGDLPGVSFGYGFFVALAGLVATAVAPALPRPAERPAAR